MGLFLNEADEFLAAKLGGETPRLRFINPHERGFENKTRLHSEIDCCLKRFDRIVAAIGIARKVCLAHPSNDDFDVAPIGYRCGYCQKKNVPSGDESCRKI